MSNYMIQNFSSIPVFFSVIIKIYFPRDFPSYDRVLKPYFNARASIPSIA